jgi:phage shock protein PspC (stress-responsive transcriptional regulator)
VRPRQGRLLAGVCGALGRATNTDPVLWRVVLVVLTIFAGIGFLAYVVAWLILPAEGDTASPIEALVGRGRSGTPTILTIIGGVIVLIALAAYTSEPFRAAPILAVVLLGGALLLLLRDRGRTRPWATASAPPPWPPSAGDQTAAGPGLMASTPDAPTLAGPTAPAPPAFAPHGPFVPPAPPPPPAPPAMRPPPPPKPPKERSRLFLLTFSVALVVVGVMALIDLAGSVVPAGGYVAAALAVVGLGLVLGAWIGRARWLIAVGIILSIVLGGMFGADRVDGWHDAGSVTYTPTSVNEIQEMYRHDVGDVTLDLSLVDFTEASPEAVDITVRLDWGNLTIILPPDVDATVETNVDVGNVQVFDQARSGLDPGRQTITDFGPDGPGGGQVRIDAAVDLGNLEVSR